MEYQAVIIGEDFTDEGLERLEKQYSDKIFCIKHCRDILLPAEPNLRINVGVVLEVIKKKDFFELHILLAGHKMIYLHSKKIVLTFYDKINDNKIISLYEVLWAAGVGLDANTLLPMTNENQETSLQGLYYREEKRAG